MVVCGGGVRWMQCGQGQGHERQKGWYRKLLCYLRLDWVRMIHSEKKRAGWRVVRLWRSTGRNVENMLDDYCIVWGPCVRVMRYNFFMYVHRMRLEDLRLAFSGKMESGFGVR
jgi:hypothetical protein